MPELFILQASLVSKRTNLKCIDWHIKTQYISIYMNIHESESMAPQLAAVTTSTHLYRAWVEDPNFHNFQKTQRWNDPTPNRTLPV